MAQPDDVNATRHIWAYRLAILWFCLFSVNSLGTVIIAALQGAVWAQLSTQAKFLIITAIVSNWTGTIMAYVSKQAKRADAGQAAELANGSAPIPEGGTGFLAKASVQVQPAPAAPQPPKTP